MLILYFLKRSNRPISQQSRDKVVGVFLTNYFTFNSLKSREIHFAEILAAVIGMSIPDNFV